MDEIGAIKAKMELDIKSYNESISTVKKQTEELKSGFGSLNESLREVGLNAEQIKRINDNLKETNPEIVERQLSRVRDELRAIGVDAKEIDKISAELESSKKNLDDYADSVNKVGLAFTGMVAAMGAVVGMSVKQAAIFEKSMSRVKAISQATAEEYLSLRDLASELGANTAFSASQAADAQTFLAMAGFKTKDILEALPGVLSLAAAGQMDLARTADIASNVLTGFGLEASEMNRVVDVMTKAMVNANTDIEQLGYAFKYVGPVSAAAGKSIEETATAIAKMSDAGIQGESAGAALRNILLNLINPTKAASEAMERIGFVTRDARGELLSLPQIISNAEKAFGKLGETQQAEEAATIAGTRAVGAFLALISTGGDEIARFTEMLENSAGAADEIATTQLDNLSGAIIELKSALEAVQITVGDAFIPMIRKVTEGLTKLALSFEELDAPTQSAIITFTTMATVGGAVTAAVYGLITALNVLKVSLRSFLVASAVIGAVALAIGGLSAAYSYLKTKQEEQEEAARKNEERIKQLVTEYDNLSASLKVYEEGSDEAIRTSERMEAIMGELADKAPDVVAAFNKQEGAIKSMTAATSAAITENIKLLQSQLAVLEADTRGVEEIGASGVAERSADIVNIRRQIDELKGQFWARADESIADDWRQLREIAEEKERIANMPIVADEGIGGGSGKDSRSSKGKSAAEKFAEQQKRIRDEMYRADLQRLQYKIDTNQMTEEQEITYLERMLKKYEDDAEKRMQLEVRIYQAKKQLAEDAAKLAEKTAKEAFDHSVNWIEAEERRMTEAGATEEQITQMKFDAWSRVKNRYAEDTEFYKRADSEVFAHKQRLIEQASAMQLEALTKQRDIQREALAEMNRAAEEALRKQIADERAKTDSVTESIKRQTDAVRERYNAQIEGIRKEIAAIDEEIRKQNELDRIEDRRAKRAELQAKRDAILADERFEKVVMGEDGQLTTVLTHDTAAIAEIDKQLKDLDIEEEREKRRQALDERKRQLNDEISAINAKRDAEIAALQAEVEAVNRARDEKIAAMQTELEALQESNKTKLEALDAYWADVLDKDKIAQDVRNEVLQEGLDVGLRKITSHLDAVMSEYQSKISAMIAMGESLSASLPMGGGIAGVSNTTNNSNSVNINSVNVTANNGNDFVNSLRRSYFS